MRQNFHGTTIYFKERLDVFEVKIEESEKADSRLTDYHVFSLHFQQSKSVVGQLTHQAFECATTEMFQFCGC